jgi:hypothetical protein
MLSMRARREAQEQGCECRKDESFNSSQRWALSPGFLPSGTESSRQCLTPFFLNANRLIIPF